MNNQRREQISDVIKQIEAMTRAIACLSMAKVKGYVIVQSDGTPLIIEPEIVREHMPPAPAIVGKRVELAAPNKELARKLLSIACAIRVGECSHREADTVDEAAHALAAPPVQQGAQEIREAWFANLMNLGAACFRNEGEDADETLYRMRALIKESRVALAQPAQQGEKG